MKNILNANDLTLSIRELYNKYNMKEYYQSCCMILGKYSKSEDIKKKLTTSFQNNNSAIHEIISEFLENEELSDEELVEFMKEMNEMQNLYNFDTYCKESLVLREDFLKSRNKYFNNTKPYKKIIKNLKIDSAYLNTFHDIVFSKWLDKSIESIKPNFLIIRYEKLDGKTGIIHASYEECILTKDYVEVRPKDFFSGICIFDSFFIHSFYDEITNSWIPVPINLIKSIETTDPKLNEKLNDDDFDDDSDIDDRGETIK